MTYLIEQVLRPQIQALNWVEKYSGVVRPYLDKSKNPAQTYPVTCFNSDPTCSETDVFTPITPNDAFMSVVYWEYSGGANIDLRERSYQVATERMRFVAWINPKKQGVTPACGLSSVYAADFIGMVRKVNNATVSNIPVQVITTRANIIEIDHEAVFGKYSYGDKQHLFVQPYEWFAIDFEFLVTLPNNCASLIAIDDAIEC